MSMPTGTYALNDVAIYPPANGQWRPRHILGISGEGRPITTGPFEFEIRYEFLSVPDFDAIHDIWSALQATGTLVAELPDILASTYSFRQFSGCYMEEPSVGQYFEQYYSEVLIRVKNINP